MVRYNNIKTTTYLIIGGGHIANKKPNNYIIDEENKIAKIELRRRNKDSLWTLIDLEDLQRVLDFPYSWCAAYRKNTDSWYARTSIHSDNKTEHSSQGLYLNYFILFNDNDTTSCVDHINHDTLDNRKCNLRTTETLHNTKNRKSKNRNNTTGYRNVLYIKSYTKHPYIVRLQIDGKGVTLGKFSNVDDAGAYAGKMRLKYYGDYAGNN